MNDVPIVFCFNDRFIIPSVVAIKSLLVNAKELTSYKFFVFYSHDRLSLANQGILVDLIAEYQNHSIEFLDVGRAFDSAFEIRNISIEAYFRLLIPDLILDYKKVLYSDVDIVFLEDLSHLVDLDMGDCLVAGISNELQFDPVHLKSINITAEKYINSGFLLFNTEKLHGNDFYKTKVWELSKQKFKYQDQDIINLACKGKIKYLDARYNWSKENIYSSDISPAVIHFKGAKPWNRMVKYSDIWWEYYRKTRYFEEDKSAYFSWQEKEYKSLDRDKKLGKLFDRIFGHTMIRLLKKMKFNKIVEL